MEDLTIRRVTKKIFPYLWLRHKLLSSTPSCSIFPLSEIAFFSNEIGNATIVYLHMYRPSLSKYLEKHIPSMAHSKMQFWTQVAFLCLQVHLANDNVFDYFLTTCSITAEVALHCYMNGYEDVLPLASVFLCAFFESELYAGFHEAGGWDGLHRYIQDTSCQDLYDLVDNYIKDLGSPSEHLPIMIVSQNEYLAAERREKFVSLLSFRIGEIERDDQTKSLVTGLFHWDFIENQRISEVKPGILKRMENIRHKKKKPKISMSEESSEADEAPEADDNISDIDEDSCLPDEDQEFVVTIPETRSKDAQTLGNSNNMENEDRLSPNNEVSDDKPKLYSSPSLRELCKFYENLSASSERRADGYKHFKSSNKKLNAQKFSAFKEITNGVETASNFERYPEFVPYSSKNGRSCPKKKIVKPKTVIKSAESFRSDDVLSEFTKSFQELGFTCLCVGNSTSFSHESFTNHAEIMEKCRYFQKKYFPLQFAVLVPSNYSKDKSTHTPEKENETVFEKQYSDQHSKDVNIQNQSKNERKEKHQNETTKVSRFTVTKINEHQSEDGVCPISEKNQTKIRFTVTKVNEDQSKDGTSILKQNRSNEVSKISRFTVTKVNENQSKNGTGILGQNRTNETRKISRFTVTKVNENQSKDGTSILRQNRTNERNKKTVRQVDDNQLRLRKDFPGYKTKVRQPSNIKFHPRLISLNLRNFSTSSQESDDTENETIQFQDNGSVKYEKRVSFAKHAYISYYQTYSSDESSNSVNSKESLSQDSAEASQSSTNPDHQEDTLRAPTPINKTKERRGFFRRHSFSGSPSSSSNTENSNKSFNFRFLGRFFRKSSSGNSEVSESPKEESDEQKTEKN